MPLTPTSNIMLTEDIEIQSQADQTSRTYRIDFNTNRITGYIDDIEAVKQAIYKILQTDRFYYLIYSWDYGLEKENLFGQSVDVLKSELERIITEALLIDERITEIMDFKLNMVDKRTAAAEFTAVSIFGEVPISEEVTV